VKGTKTQTSKKQGRESKKSRYNKEYERCMTEEIPEYLGRERKKNDNEIQIWKWGDIKQVLDGRRGKKVQNVLWGKRDSRAHVERM
jgi:hypothetical protein